MLKTGSVILQVTVSPIPPSPRFTDASNVPVPTPWLDSSLTIYNFSQSLALYQEIESATQDNKNIAEIVAQLIMKEDSFWGLNQSALGLASKLRWYLYQKLSSSNDHTEGHYICKICFTDQTVWCATPCGHVVSCVNCHSVGLTNNNRNYLTKCSQCRTVIKK